MNKRQAKRIALAVEASYLIYGAETSCVIDQLSDKDGIRFREAQLEMAWDMLKKAGFEEPGSPEEIIEKVLSS